MEQLSLLDSGVKDIMAQPAVAEPEEPAADGVQIIAVCPFPRAGVAQANMIWCFVAHTVPGM